MVTFASIASDITFGLGLLSSFGQQVDVVGIYGQDTFTQMFQDARPLKGIIRETSKVMDHPAETGVVLPDHHIINPVEIDLPLLIPAASYSGTFTQIRQAFINATSLSVKTRVGVYQDMIIADMPHDEDPEMYDAIIVGLRLKQVLYVVAGNGTQAGGMLVNFQPIDPLNSNTSANGLQQATALAGSALTAATAAASYANLGKFL